MEGNEKIEYESAIEELMEATALGWRNPKYRYVQISIFKKLFLGMLQIDAKLRFSIDDVLFKICNMRIQLAPLKNVINSTCNIHDDYLFY